VGLSPRVRHTARWDFNVLSLLAAIDTLPPRNHIFMAPLRERWRALYTQASNRPPPCAVSYGVMHSLLMTLVNQIPRISYAYQCGLGVPEQLPAPQSDRDAAAAAEREAAMEKLSFYERQEQQLQQQKKEAAAAAVLAKMSVVDRDNREELMAIQTRDCGTYNHLRSALLVEVTTRTESTVARLFSNAISEFENMVPLPAQLHRPIPDEMSYPNDVTRNDSEKASLEVCRQFIERDDAVSSQTPLRLRVWGNHYPLLPAPHDPTELLFQLATHIPNHAGDDMKNIGGADGESGSSGSSEKGKDAGGKKTGKKDKTGSSSSDRQAVSGDKDASDDIST
jgi:hypothetical protein